MRNCETLYIVLPCFNEEEALPKTASVLNEKLSALVKAGRIGPDSRALFVDDGSKDGTWNLICQLHQQSPYISGLKLSRNKGHQNALLAGLLTAKDSADAVISMDADLQDDVSVIDGFLDRYCEGFDVVYGVRSDRKKDSAFKRCTARAYYRLLRMMGVEIVTEHADCRLLSKRALEGLAQFKEVNLFLRGLVPMIGYPSATFEFERNERVAGSSKYPLKKMLALAWQGITSMSVKPIRFIIALGVTLLTLAVACIIAFAILLGCGYASWQLPLILAVIGAACGINLIAIGVIGEYVGKIYLEVKERPRFLIEDYLK